MVLPPRGPACCEIRPGATTVDSELKDRRQFPARNIVPLSAAESPMRECAMKRLLPGLIGLCPLASAHAQAAEPSLESHPIATIAFVLLFVGFCVVFAWMVWRNKDK
jgi:hypothetical protein